MTSFRIENNRENLTKAQNLQFMYAIMEGLKGKYAKVLDDDKKMLAINEIWIKHGCLPMDETFCAIDNDSGEVLAILLLNNFKEPSPLAMLLSTVKSFRVAGIRKILKIVFAFISLGLSNHHMASDDVVAEIFLVSTREAHRGKGAGSELIKHALEYVKERKCRCGHGENCTCKVMLLVFNKNPAKRLYERLGFRAVKSLPTPKLKKAFGDDYDVLVKMERPLK
jgi:ribosomal protein S18 acetylase RimI-like enzyme